MLLADLALTSAGARRTGGSRAKLRFGLLSGAVGLLVFLILFQQALLGSLLLSFTGAIENQSGTVLVYSEEARKNLSASVVLPPQQAQIEAVDGVGASAPLGRGHLHHRGRRHRHRRLGVRVPARWTGGAHPSGGGPPAVHPHRGRGQPRGPLLPASASATSSPASTAASRSPSSGLTERSRFSVSPTLWVTFDGYTALRKAANPDATAVVPSALALTPADGVSAVGARRPHRRPGRRRAGPHPQPGGERGPRRVVGEHVVPADPRSWRSWWWRW